MYMIYVLTLGLLVLGVGALLITELNCWTELNILLRRIKKETETGNKNRYAGYRILKAVPTVLRLLTKGIQTKLPWDKSSGFNA